MNLRNASSYNVGLDLGTGSVGWAVTDEDGELLHFKGRPTLGSRLFPTAETAADTRLKRGQRRRYERRRWRLNLLQGLFQDEMEQVDDEFFIRLNQSRLLQDDRAEGHADYHWPLFNDSGFTEPIYYAKFPTIYHLRAWLMKTDEKADLRLIYLAFHNIVKARGNFLHQSNPNLSAGNADMTDSVETLCLALSDWCEAHDIETACCDHVDDICKALEDSFVKRGDKQKSVQSLLSLDKEHEKTLGVQISKAFVGYVAEFASIFLEEAEGSKFSLSNDDAVEEYLGHIPDEGMALFDAIRGVYSAFVLSGILSSGDGEPISSGALDGVTGKTISYCKVREYVQYGHDLSLLKQLVRTYVPNAYDDFFRGDFYDDKSGYDPAKASGYTKYNLVRGGTSYEDFKKSVAKLFDKTAAENDEHYQQMMAAFDEEKFLRRLKTSDNGSVPYQLHLEEMDAIIQSQGRFYPFLLEQSEKIESLVSFRIPYYVGPLTLKNAAVGPDGKPRFAWANHRPGKEDEPVYPWNWSEIIDKNKAAQQFIDRMTSDCTYLLGEPVLPKCSLLYEEYCVLNELNGAHWTQDGDRQERFDAEDRRGIIDGLFKQKRSVTYKSVEDWMREHRGWPKVCVSGGQGETKFESGMASYRFFCKDVFHVDELPDAYVHMVEQIILLNTLFEDRSILKEELKRAYGDRLTDGQIKTICKKRFTGWGRLSKKFLTGIKANTDNGAKSIMDVLRDGCPTNGKGSRAMVLMEVIHDEDLGFEKIIEQENQEKLTSKGQLDVNDLPGSPANRRTVNQAIRIVKEIADIAGRAPAHIFIETTRDEDAKNKGKRTRRRRDNIKDALAVFRTENAELRAEFKERDPKEFDDDRLTLYFMQGGKSLYSGKPLDIRRLSEYQVDHIIPQSYIKDDSLENKALVLSSENQSKTNSLLITPQTRQRMAGYWRELHRAKLIGDKKFNNLMTSEISERKIKGFIARQLVETSQSTKLTKIMLESWFPETRVLGVRAGLSHELREAENYVKCREINDFHHAHDALLAAEVGRFILKRHSGMYDNPIGYTHVVKDFVHVEAKEAKRTGRMPGSSGFIISSFLRSGFDPETGEIFKDDWNANFECERIRKFLNYKQVFISRMPEETSGAFWKATIYSPRNKKKTALLPVKSSLDIRKYGGFSEIKYSYFFIYEVRDKRKNKKLIFSPVPLNIAESLTVNLDALEVYASKEALRTGNEFLGIVRNKVYKYQKIKVGFDYFYITAADEVRNACQLSFSQEQTCLFKTMLKERNNTVNTNRLFTELKGKLTKRAPSLSKNIKINKIEEEFVKCSYEEQSDVLKSIAGISHADTNKIDLRAVKGVKTAGQLKKNFNNLLNSKEGITFIDQSVTGMFERRTHIGL